MQMLRSHCCYCSMQCALTLEREDGDSLKHAASVFEPGLQVKAAPDFPVATGKLCQKGLHVLEHAAHRERVLEPMRRLTADGGTVSSERPGRWKPADWDETLDSIAERIHAIRQRYGPDAIGVYGGGSLTNEVSYLLGKFARVALGTRYIDYNGRYCMSSAAAASNRAFGLDRGMTMPLSDIPNARYLILAGTNVAECQPTMIPYLLAAKKKGAILVTIDPRNTLTSKLADIHVRLQPGFDSVFISGLLHVILEEGLEDRAFLETRVGSGLEEVRKAVQPYTPEKVEAYTGILAAVVRTIARGFAKAETGMVLTARGLEQQTNGVENTLQYINLALLTGKIGRPGCGYGAITGQANGQGGREHGQKADQLPGYRLIEDPTARAHVAEIWGIDPEELPGKGVSAYELLEKVGEGEIKALIVLGSNPVVSSPNASRVEEHLKKLELLVVVDLFETETAKLAHWLLPAPSFLESEGTLTNLEGRVFHRAKLLESPGRVKQDWALLCELADRLGRGRYFQYNSPSDIFDELCRASAGGPADYSGLSYDRLRGQDGVYWPCPSPEHPGTPAPFAERFAHPDGKARLFGVTPKLPAEPVDDAYPYVLTTGRLGSHYLSGAQTRRSPGLHRRSPVPVAEVHPWLAKRIGLTTECRIRLTSRRGSAVFDVRVTEGIHPRTIFVPFHWGGSLSVNRLTVDRLDPVSRMPEFKLCAVQAEKA